MSTEQLPLPMQVVDEEGRDKWLVIFGSRDEHEYFLSYPFKQLNVPLDSPVMTTASMTPIEVQTHLGGSSRTCWVTFGEPSVNAIEDYFCTHLIDWKYTITDNQDFMWPLDITYTLVNLRMWVEQGCSKEYVSDGNGYTYVR